MDVAIFCAALLLLTAFVARPLYERAKPSTRPLRSEAEQRLKSVVRALADLEIDYASGAVDEATYLAERGALEARARSQVERPDEPHD